VKVGLADGRGGSRRGNSEAKFFFFFLFQLLEANEEMEEGREV
jgi:hypothetical protein